MLVYYTYLHVHTLHIIQHYIFRRTINKWWESIMGILIIYPVLYLSWIGVLVPSRIFFEKLNYISY